MPSEPLVSAPKTLPEKRNTVNTKAPASPAAVVRKLPKIASAFCADDGASSQADKPGFYPFSVNPQQENPASGYIVSANYQPPAVVPIPGYYNLADRGRQLDRQLANPEVKWDTQNSQALQLDTTSDYGPRTLAPLLATLRQIAQGDEE